MPRRIAIGVSPNRPPRSFGFAAASPVLGSPPVFDPGGGRNWSVSGRTDDPFGLNVVPAPDESAGTVEVESDWIVETESDRAAVEPGLAAVESGRAAVESVRAAAESGLAGVELALTAVESVLAAAPLVEARAASPLRAPHATATTNTRRSWRSRHAAHRRIGLILDDARPDGDAKISAGRGSLRSDPG